jgi:hypothetical protein
LVSPSAFSLLACPLLLPIRVLTFPFMVPVASFE